MRWDWNLDPHENITPITGSRLSKNTHMSFSLATSSRLFCGMPRHSQASWKKLSLQHVLGLPWGLFPVGRAWNTSTGRCLGVILTKCLDHLNWLLSMQRSSGFTLSLSRISKLCTQPRHCAEETWTPLLGEASHSLPAWSWSIYTFPADNHGLRSWPSFSKLHTWLQITQVNAESHSPIRS